MILIASKNQALTQKLSADLKQRGSDVRVVAHTDPQLIYKIYAEDTSALVIDDQIPNLPSDAFVDIINSLSRRTPVIVLGRSVDYVSGSRGFSEQTTLIHAEDYEEILATAAFSASGAEVDIRQHLKAIPFYNQQIPINILKNNGALGILTVDASGLQKIGVDFGNDVYTAIKQVLNDVIFNLWGPGGCLRDSDVICRKSQNSNTYLVFMSRSRETGALPFPGALEKVADRLSQAINNAMWKELFLPHSKRRIPECVQTVPLLGVGFFGVLNNPCIDIHEIIDGGLEASKNMAQSQLKRGRERQRELMQTLIQADSLLTAHYQGVFLLQGIRKEMIDEARSSKSIAPLSSHVYGFESLIRVNTEVVKQHNSFDSGIESQYLRPDVLFSLAKSTNVALELDQACMRHAARDADDLPGVLMVNILPRNLYHIDRLKSHFSSPSKVMFEVSESEAINNLELMLKAREHLETHSMGIAADDFGKGYSSLERIIKIRPDVIKFDRGMIQEIDKDPVKQAYVKGLVDAAKILNTTILAEGVETWEEAKILQAMGIELIQGYLFHRPESAQSIRKQIEVLAPMKIQGEVA